MSILMNLGACCMVLSIWGVIQLMLMGIFFKVESTSFLHTVVAEEYEDADDFIRITKKNYSTVGVNCFIAAAMYIVTAGISIMCIRSARKAQKLRNERLQDDDISCRTVKKETKSKPKLK